MRENCFQKALEDSFCFFLPSVVVYVPKNDQIQQLGTHTHPATVTCLMNFNLSNESIARRRRRQWWWARESAHPTSPVSRAGVLYCRHFSHHVEVRGRWCLPTVCGRFLAFHLLRRHLTLRLKNSSTGTIPSVAGGKRAWCLITSINFRFLAINTHTWA